MTPARWVLLLILLTGATLRLIDGARAPLEHTEAYEFIPAAMTLSLEHHPIRMAQHSGVPMYLIRGSALVFGDSTLGLRVLSIIAGTATILLLYLVAARWWNPWSGLTAAALLAVERYHTKISARAHDLPFDLFFIVLAMFCVSRFLHASRDADPRAPGRWLYGAAAASALGFLCKEFTALMMPVILLSAAFVPGSNWLRRREPWLAVLLFVVLILPDIYSNFTVTHQERLALFNRQREALRLRQVPEPEQFAEPFYAQNGLYMSYGDQLSRFKSFGFEPEPFYFYFGDIIDRFGIRHENTFEEFPYMHPVMGAVLWAAVAFGAIRRRKDELTRFSLIMFGVMFVPFALVRLGEPRATFPTDPQALWYWVDRTMLPAMLLAGSAVAVVAGRLRKRRAPTEPSSTT